MQRQIAMIISLCACAVVSVAQQPARSGREVTVAYLRAAIGSIRNGDRLRLSAEYDADYGLLEANERYLRGKGYSRFSIVDPKTGVRFSNMYVDQDTDAFRTLLDLKDDTRVTLYGYKGRGEEKDPAMIVTSVRIEADNRKPGEKDDARSPVAVAGRTPEADATDGKGKYRVIITDLRSTNRTVLVGVELGKDYNVLGTAIRIEREEDNSPGGNVRVLQSE